MYVGDDNKCFQLYIFLMRHIFRGGGVFLFHSPFTIHPSFLTPTGTLEKLHLYTKGMFVETK